jgi:hypothetical protein
MYTKYYSYSLSLSLSLSHILPIFNTNLKINNLNIIIILKVRNTFLLSWIHYSLHSWFHA